jgi:hypothetical protein
MPEKFNIIKKLHTDVLEEKYGSIHSEVLRHDKNIREVHMLDKGNISRTYALTFINFDRNNKTLAEIDEKIKNGGLIGKVFRDYGYEIRKNVVSVFTTPLPKFLLQKMATESEKAKVRLSEFYAKKEGEEPIIYGTVSEIYSPDFRPAEVNDADIAQENPLTEAMESVGLTKEDIWNRLGNNNNFSDVGEQFEQAKQVAMSKEQALKDKVEDYLKYHENIL